MGRATGLATWALLVAAVAAGCNGAGALDNALLELQTARDEVQQLKRENQKLHGALAGQRRQIRTLQALGRKRLEKLVRVEKIALGRYTAGADLDGKAGHDGIKVYVRLVDQHGSAIKAAGDVTIQLYDLAAPPKQNLVGEYRWKADKINDYWASGFVSYYYVFECRWQRPPKHDEITVRAQFVDYLTGKTFAAQKVVKVIFPPGPPPAK